MIFDYPGRNAYCSAKGGNILSNNSPSADNGIGPDGFAGKDYSTSSQKGTFFNFNISSYNTTRR